MDWKERLGRIPDPPPPPDFACDLEEGEWNEVQYHALQRQPEGLFIPCAKILYNGRTRLIYLPGERRALSDVTPRLSSARLEAVRGLIARSVERVRENGLLRIQNVFPAPERIYVDRNAKRVSLTYFPLREPLFEDEAAFGQALQETTGVILPDMKRRFPRLQGIGNSYAFTLDRDEYILGRDRERAHGLLKEGNISNVHCKINRVDKVYAVTDMKSTYNTYLNEQLLKPLSPYPLQNGDTLKLDDLSFRFVLEQEDAP